MRRRPFAASPHPRLRATVDERNHFPGCISEEDPPRSRLPRDEEDFPHFGKIGGGGPARALRGQAVVGATGTIVVMAGVSWYRPV